MNIQQVIKLRDALLAARPSQSDLRKDSFPTYLSFLALMNLQFPEEEEDEGEDDTPPLLAHMLDIDPAAANALLHPVNVGKITNRKLIDVFNHLIETGEVNWAPGATSGTPPLPVPGVPAGHAATPTRSLAPVSGTYSGPPPPSLRLLAIFGQEAVYAYENDERDEAVLQSLGTLKRHKFLNLGEMNAYIQGAEDATGHLGSLIIEISSSALS
jgi:hypothetical protein